MRAFNAFVLAGLVLLPSSAVAQARPASRAAAAGVPRFRVSFNAGIEQPASQTFDATTTKTVNVETARFTTSYEAPRGPSFDGGVLVRLVGGFGVGAAFSAYNKSTDGSVAGTVPHPFFFNTPRPINGVIPALERSETAVHVQVAYVVESRRLDVAVSGGPTFFNVSQDLASDVAYTETYPYDTAAFASATVSRVSVSATGFNVGADVGWKFSKTFGVGGLIRYSKASATFPLAGTTSGVATDVGGIQAGGGVRFWF